MLKLSLCVYSDEYMHVRGTTTIAYTVATGAAGDNADKKVTFKSCTPFADSMSEINNRQVDNTKDIDVVMPMYNLIEYSDIYSKH